ncbi:MAG: DUF3761 domain-containing protein [Dehalococcoidia bacterium]|nr:DUF3761 domain-containing protein [Dehalococcoidia bacterium]
MMATRLIRLLRSHTGRLGSGEDRPGAEAVRPEACQETYLFWSAGIISAVIVLVAFVIIMSSYGALKLGGSPPAFAAEQLAGSAPALANRSSCAEIDGSDLRSPLEGVWFQSNCVLNPELPLAGSPAGCNRTSLGPAEFTEFSQGLYVFRQTHASPAYLWYSSSETCFDLVSARVVTAVCADQAVSFGWNARSACSGHGGVLAWVNGR